MAPKKKGGKIKSGGAGGIIDGVDISQMSREQLEAFCYRIRDENEREREERNFFQIERDKLHNFWEITKNELEEVKAKLRNKDREIEEADEKNDDEIKFYKQQVKHLKYEHQANLTECKAEGLVALKMAQDEHILKERELLSDIDELKRKIREQNNAYEDLIKALKLKHSEESSREIKEFESRSKAMELKYSERFSKVIEEMQTQMRMEVSEVEERKNCQISALISDHQKQFTEMKNYFNDITLNNLALISSLKDQMSVLRKQADEATNTASTISSENRKLSEPLKKAECELSVLRKQLKNYNKDKLAFDNTKANLHDMKKEFDSLKWSNEHIKNAGMQLQVERDQLHNKFVRAVLEIQQKTGLKNAHLQKRIKMLSDAAEYNQSVIEELTSTSDMPSQHKKFEDYLANKNLTIKNLNEELSKTREAYNELLEMYQHLGEPSFVAGSVQGAITSSQKRTSSS